MTSSRSSGILIHPTSLPGRFGIGDLGSEAYRFADFLADAKQRLWQLLPLGPIGYGNSPYQCHSVFAGNPLLLSLETLEHAADPPAFLAELRRVARPGAILVLSCPPATSEIPYRIYTALFGGHGEGPHRFLPSRVVLRLLGAAGWEVTWRRGTLLVPVGPRWLRRFGERLIERFPGGFLAELGIRQFYVARRS